MAKIIRDIDDSANTGERIVRDSLVKLPDNYDLYFNIRELYNAKNREEDVLICNDKGIYLIIEIKNVREFVNKGNNVVINYGDGRGGVRDKDPYAQAEKNMREDILQLKRKGFVEPPLFGYGVWFTSINCEQINQRISTGGLKEITLGLQDLKDPQEAINRIESYWRQAGARVNRDIRNDIFKIKSIDVYLSEPVSLRITKDNNRILRATENQFDVLYSMAWDKLKLVLGCAGSGKTLMAIEQAIRFAKGKKKSLIVCYNDPLAKFIRHLFAKENDEIKKYVEVKTIDSLIDLLDKNIPEENKKYCIFIDEGQDITEEQQDKLKRLLVNDGQYFIFADDYQNVYRRKNDQRFDEKDVIRLRKNCRNSKKVFQLLKKFYDNSETLENVVDVDGEIVPVEYDLTNKSTLEIGNKIKDVLRERKIPFSDCVVLTPCAKGNSILSKDIKVGDGNTISWDDEWRKGNIQISTIRTFKGQEREYVVLIEIDKYPKDLKNEILYVAVSRAKLGLIIIGSQSEISEVMAM